MRKIIFVFLIIGLLSFSACQRSESPGPGDMFGPSSTAYVLTLSAHPSVVQALDPLRNPANSEVTLRARLYSYDKGPMANRTVYFYIYDVNIPFTPQEGWNCWFGGGYGLLNGDQVKSVRATTNANGVAIAKYTPPHVGDLKVYCDTGEEDDSGNPIIYAYIINEMTVLIKATWRGQQWPEDNLSEVYAITPIKILR